MALGGYANHVARIDLSSGSVAYEGINEEDARLYIGARGLGVKYVYDNDPATDPSSPDNLLGLVNGPLDRHGSDDERPPGLRHQVAANRHGGR